MSRRLLAALGAIGILALSAGCSNDDASNADSTTDTGGTASASAAPPAEMMARQFGDGCAAVPTDPTNPGSFDAMAKVPVATAASGNPVLSTLVTAVQKANLVDSLNSAEGITVFAPTNEAFARIPQADLAMVLADNATLTKILTFHVVPGRLSTEQLAGTHKTLQGGTVTVTGSGTAFMVGTAAKVVCGNVSTANATVYLIDTVLMPA
jgi:uncharacterized surface protein with fasciclin (FAS1) repeats